MYFKNVIFVAKTCKYGIFVAKICKYNIFVAKIYKYALIDSFQESAGSLDSAASCAALCWTYFVAKTSFSDSLQFGHHALGCFEHG